MSNVFRPFLTVFAAVSIVGALSMFPWSDLTGRYFKDYNLLADLHPSAVIDAKSDDIIDPLLKEAMACDQDAAHGGLQRPDSIDLADSLQHLPKVEDAQNNMVNTTLPPLGEGYLGENKAATVNGIVVLEDYTNNGTGLDHFLSALDRRDYQPVRIAFIGDSYIEGDIFTQDVRAMLQSKFGGQGPGYVNLQSDITGFRQSVRQSGGEGWTGHDMRHKQSLRPLSGQFFTANGATTATYKGTKQVDNARCWGTSIFMFSSPEDAVISYSTTGNEWVDYPVSGSDKVQCLRVDVPTESFSIKTSSPNMTGYGVWLGDWNGIQVDCMSLRGNSGLTHKELDPELAAQMRKFIDYDMIVVEYGINALDSSRTDYTFYGNQMATVVQRLRQCYPRADIVLMGIGDRGQKIGAAVQSMPTAQHMVEAQRQAAKKSQCVFWDTRQAMGGENAIVSWRERNLVNGDFIHLNHRGGTALAKLFIDALDMGAFKD